MLTVMLAATVSVFGGGDVMWLEAREIGAGGVSVTEGGDYWLWAWAPGDGATGGSATTGGRATAA